MNPADLVILAAVAVLLFFAIRFLVRHRGQSCGGNCAGCPYHNQCEKKEKK